MHHVVIIVIIIIICKVFKCVLFHGFYVVSHMSAYLWREGITTYEPCTPHLSNMKSFTPSVCGQFIPNNLD